MLVSMSAAIPAILVVEDDPIARAVVCTALGLRGLIPTTCGTVREARGLLGSRDWDLVILDLRLPDGGGLRLAQYLHENGWPRMLVVTGDALAAHSLGYAVPVLLKPVDPVKLCGMVETLLLDLEPRPGSALLPAIVAAAVEPRATDHPAIPMGRALVVDDDPVFRAFTVATLRTDGWDVDAVESAAQACMALEKGKPVRLVLLDLSMRLIDGMAVAIRIRSHRPDVGLLIITGDHQRVASAREYAEVLTKPVVPEELLAAARRIADQVTMSGSRRPRIRPDMEPS
jgi:CheY-like chemotaxis protein